MADRPVRVRGRDAGPAADGSGSPSAEIAAGILQHLQDDDWFHTTRAFAEVSHDLTRRFRELLQKDDSPRAPFLGHIVTEILLDGVLASKNPDRLEEYYRQLATICGQTVQDAVNRMSRRTTDRLALFVDLFLQEQFLWDYSDSNRLLHRLNQVLRRVTLDPLPSHAPAMLDACRDLVTSRRHELLPGFSQWL